MYLNLNSILYTIKADPKRTRKRLSFCNFFRLFLCDCVCILFLCKGLFNIERVFVCAGVAAEKDGVRSENSCV